MAAAAEQAGWRCDEAPVSDGGEGLLDALGGAVRRARVHGPLGDFVDAEWRMLDDRTAVIEMARASGLVLAGGPEGNDPIRANTTGTGELIAAALHDGARRVIVGLGGSATTDGGLACLTALHPARLSGVELVVACDVATRFVDAADVFAPQKGASPSQVALLRRRLERLVQVYEDDYGVDVSAIEGAGAAGGLAGGLAAVGAELVPGFELVADAIELAERVEHADLVVAGEGFLDEQSFCGKAVGGVVDMARQAGVPVLVIVGDRDIEPADLPVVSLVERFGDERARHDTLACVQEVVAEALQQRSGGR